MLKQTIIFDLDGTLANGKHRNHLVPAASIANLCSSWEVHNLASVDDTPIADTIEVCNTLYQTFHIIILTGRCEVARGITVAWLEEHGVQYDELIMRPEGDDRPDILYKEEALLLIGLDTILCCYDDLEHVAIHMRDLGLTCYLVNKYNKKRVNTLDNSEWEKLDE